MRAKKSARRYIALALAALVSIPLSLSGLWVDGARATDPGHDSIVDFALDNTPGAANNGYVLENQQVIPATSSFTVEVWVKPDSLLRSWNQIVHNRTGNNFNRFDINVGNGVAGSTQVQVLYGWATDAINLRPAGLQAPIGQWTHIAVSVEIINSGQFKISLFRNGTLVYEETKSATVAALDDDFYVGYHPGFTPTSDRTFDGQIDQLKVWDSALNSTQVSQSMHALGASGVTGTPTLRASYDFNEGLDSSTAYDRVGSRDLTKVGTNSRFDVKQTAYASNGRTVVTFPRTYLPGVGGWTAPANINSANALVVGGGGGGGSRHAGGGGAGALLYQEAASISGTLRIQVGQGGKGNLGITNHNGQLGGGSGQSTFLGTTELRGGGGGAGAADGAQAGGSGGGMSGPSDPPAQATGTGLFNRGGKGAGNASGNYAGGGGGGAGSAGSTAELNVAGAGGAGFVTNISGVLECYAAGGGGGAETNDTAGAAGPCTSGQVTATVTSRAGAGSIGSTAASSAAPNSGSGGGGGGYHTANSISAESGFGGSGVVIVSYATRDLAWNKTGTSQNYASVNDQVVPSTGSWTFEAWVYPDSAMFTDGSLNGIFSQQNDSNTEANRAGLWVDNDGSLAYNHGGVQFAVTNYKLEANKWYHVALTSTGSVVKVFVNAQEVYSLNHARETVGSNFVVGGLRQSNYLDWQGQIDQVKVWGSALTDSQLLASMHTHSTAGITSPPTLRAHYDFNEFVTGQVLDRSGNNRHLTFNTGVSGSYASSNFVDTAIVSNSTVTTNRVFQFNRTYLTADGGWIAPAGTTSRYSAVVVGGGGGGGSWVGGGGGAGGFTESLNRTYSSELLPIQVGQGGLGGAKTTSNQADAYVVDGVSRVGIAGQSSSLGDLTMLGGGRGGSHYTSAATTTETNVRPTTGGSGGGGAGKGGASGITPVSYLGAIGTSGQGNSGGDGDTGQYNSGGGGGAGAAGATGTSSRGGNGGSGKTTLVTGSSLTLAGGGGGATFAGSTHGIGGAGGGGNSDTNAANGAANTGSGGGGGASASSLSASTGGSGGSGVVLLAFQIVPDAPTSVAATSGSLVGLSWSPPAFIGEGSITDYVVQYRVSPSGQWFTFNDGVSTNTSTNVSGLDVCKKYDFQVAAKNSFGNSVYSTSASAIVGVGTFSSVAGVTPTTTATRCVLNFAEVGATTWTAPSGTTSADVLAVGGGAGGWGDGGGGGGGGSGQHQTAVALPNSAVTMTVGAGGAGGRYQGADPTAGSDSVATIGSTTIRAKGGSTGGGWTVWTGGAAGVSGTGGTYLAGGAGGRGPTVADVSKAAGSSTNVIGPDGPGKTGLTSPIDGSTFSTYGGGGGGGASSYSITSSSVEVPRASGGAGGGGAGAGVSTLGGIYKCTAVPSAPRGASVGSPGVSGTGGGGGGGIASGDPCDSVSLDGDDGERTDGGAGGSGAIVVSFLIPNQVALASSAICDGTSTQNTLTVEAGHGEVFYIDTGQGQEIDAAYIAYRVKSVSARSDLWVEVTGFTGGSVTLANNNDSALPLGSVAGNGTKTAFFMVKARNATTTAQSHVVNVYDSKPTIGDPEPIYTCNYTFTAVEETIKAAANKVNSVTTSAVAQLGATMTITVDGDSGTIGQGNDIDGRMIWLTPAARSNWPTGALRLESTTLTMYSNSQRTSVLSTHSDTLRINATTSPALSGTNRQYYRAVYTFRVIGPAAATAPIIPVAMISSGTQIKHTDVSGINGGTVDIRTPVVNLAVTKNVSPTTTVNSDGTTTFDYTVSLVNSGSQTLVIDEVIDSPDTALTYRSGSAQFHGSAIEDPGIVGTKQLGFSGPLTLPANSTRNITYKMVGETCAVGATYKYSNTATARSGTVVIGSGSATQSVVDIRGNCGEPQAVVEVKNEPIPPTATTSAATSIGTTTATINGLVDPNGEPGLNIRFVYSTSPTLATTTAVSRDNSTASANSYAVTAPLTGLNAGTTYYYRIEIKDKAGNWVQGEIMSFTTSPAPANPTAQTNAVTEISETTARFNGAIDANLVSGGAKVTYEWGIANNDGTCTGSAPTSIQATAFLQSEGASGPEDAILTGANPASMTFEATGLTPGAKYCVRINAHHGAGFNTKVSGAWVPFTMAAKLPQTISYSSSIAILPAGGSTTVNAGSTSGLAVTYTSTDTSICSVNSSTGVVTAVATSGVCSITATQAGDSSYYAATPKTVSFEISPPVITTLQSEISSGTYRSAYTEQLDATGGNGTYTTWTVSRDSLPPGLSLNPATGAITGTPTAAGIYTFSVTTTSNGVVSEPKTYTITIAKVVVTVTASNATVAFGAAVPAVTPSYSGFVGGDSSTVLNSAPNIKPTCSTNYLVGDNAGTSTRTTSCSGAWSENYTFTYVAGTVTINKLAITVTAMDAVKQNLYTNSEATVRPDPSFTGKYSFSPQLPAGQSLSDAIPNGVSVSRTNTASTTFDALGITWPTGEAPGTYAITPSGATTSTNYNITYVVGVFTIQTPKAVPVLSATNKVIDFGTNPSSALQITVTSTCSPTTGTTTFQYFNGSTWASITDVSNLGAGLYTIKARFVPDDTSDCFGRGSEVLETSYQLTVQKATATITASTSQKWVGDADPDFTWTVTGLTGSTTSADIGRVNLVRTTGEDPGSYNVTPSGASHPNFNFNYVQGKLYIGKIIINTTDSGGVLTDRTVSLTCAGLKPGAAVSLKLTSPDQTVASGTVASDGTCPVTGDIPSNVLGNFQLKSESKFPTEVLIQASRPVSLVADPPTVAPSNNNNSGGGGGGGGNPAPTASPSPTPSPTPTRSPGPTRPTPGNTAAPRPQAPVVTPTPAPTSQNVAKAPTRPDPQALPPLATPPVIPGIVVRPPAAPTEPGRAPAPPSLERATVDTGAGIQDAVQVQDAGGNLGSASRQSGVRTVDELASERLGGFAPEAGLRVEILGARTGARFVLADLQAIDAVALIRAMEASITTQEADFSKITRVVRGERPLIQKSWTPEVREGINEFFEAVGLDAPRALIDLDLNGVDNWVSIQAEVETYQPGSTVFLIATSSPIVLATAEVDQFGKAQLAGAMPVEALGNGEHRVRVVGIRSLEGVSVDGQGEIQLSADLMDEIQRFDPGTQSTIALSGLNPEGGYHSAIRVVPLIPVAPWWTLWFILAGFVLAIGARYRRYLDTASRRIIAASGVVASALPAVIIGWVSTVTNVVWVGILLGLVGAVLSWFMPEQKKPARRK